MAVGLWGGHPLECCPPQGELLEQKELEASHTGTRTTGGCMSGKPQHWAGRGGAKMPGQGVMG